MALESAGSTASVTLNAGILTITGSFFGVEFDALLAGFFGGMVFLTYVPVTIKWRVGMSLAASALFAGYFAPIAAAALLHYVPWLEIDMTKTAVRLVAAAALGLGGQSLVPLLPTLLNKFVGRVKG